VGKDLSVKENPKKSAMLLMNALKGRMLMYWPNG